MYLKNEWTNDNKNQFTFTIATILFNNFSIHFSGVFLNIRERIKDIFCVEIMEKIMIMISYTLDKCLLKDLTLECRDSKMVRFYCISAKNVGSVQ